MKLSNRICAAMAPLGLMFVFVSHGALASPNVVNISGTQNGEETGGANCSIACEGPLIDPAQISLGPGSYRITDAWGPAGLQSGALYDAWNFEGGNPTAWAWHWKMLKDDGSNGSTINTSNYASFLLADVDSTEAFSSESAAAQFGYATAPTEFTLTTTMLLDFVVNDYYLADNAGGVSLNIACTGGPCRQPVNPVPEPSGPGLFALGVLGIAWLARKRMSAENAST